MSRLPPKRPNSLYLWPSHRDSFDYGHSKSSLFNLMPDLSWRRMLAVTQGHVRGIRKSKFVHIVLIVLLFIMITMHKLSKNQFFTSGFCSNSEKVLVKGRAVCNEEISMKYLTYQPPGGGWNNQRIAFENAVIIAKLLNRTLIVHPMAPHQQILKIKKLGFFDLSHEAYNKVPTEKLLPLSKIINLSLLSRLLPVKEIVTNHTTFIADHQHLPWYRVCHNGFQGSWVDSLPNKRDVKAWNALRKYSKDRLHNIRTIPAYRRSCKSDMAEYSNTNDTIFWGIIDELSKRTESMLYFEEGSMFFRQMLFLNKKRTLDAHNWLMRFVTFAEPIWQRLRFIKRQIGYPYNAIHVRRTDHPTSRNLTQDNWLRLLKKRHALNITSRLYVATDEKNLTWFDPFRQAGYNLMFAKNFIKHSNENIYNSQDIIGLTEQLICAHAYEFVGSYYSTFSLYIKRLRKQSSWMGQLLRQPYFLVTWVNGI